MINNLLSYEITELKKLNAFSINFVKVFTKNKTIKDLEWKNIVIEKYTQTVYDDYEVDYLSIKMESKNQLSDYEISQLKKLSNQLKLNKDCLQIDSFGVFYKIQV